MRQDGGVDCELAREALSARLDGEREPVPSARVDEHLRICGECANWLRDARGQAGMLRRLSGAGPDPAADAGPGAPEGPTRRFTHQGRRLGMRSGLRAGLAVAGLVLLGLAVAQASGVDFGMLTGQHGAGSGSHLLNESTAWSAAVGLAAVVAAVRPAAAPGLACVLVAYTGFLGYYVIVDAGDGHVTAARIASHAPVAVAAVLAVLVWRTDLPHHPSPDDRAGDPPGSGQRPARHLFSTDDSAA